MRTWLVPSACAAGLLLVAAMGGVILLFAATTPSCLDSYVTSVPSLDGRLKAVLFTRNCGATAGLDTELAVLPAHDQTLPQDGNAWLRDQSGRRYLALGGSEVRLVWTNPHRLEVHCGASRLVEDAADAASVALAVGSACLARTP